MFDWLTTRLRRASTEPERIPEQVGPKRDVCQGTRRGHSQRPVRSVRIQNRARNRRARASRKRNRI